MERANIADTRGNAKHARDRTNATPQTQKAAPDRSYVRFESRDAERARLETLADELKGVFAEVPADDEQFVFTVAPGTPPRLWIDLTSFVIMGRDGRTYRFLKDSRLGRNVIRESVGLYDMANIVTHYVAERIIEREWAIEGDWVIKRILRGETGERKRQHDTKAVMSAKELGPKRQNLGWVAAAFFLGVLVGIVSVLAFGWVTVPDAG